MARSNTKAAKAARAYRAKRAAEAAAAPAAAEAAANGTRRKKARVMSSATEITRWARKQVALLPHLTTDVVVSAVALAYLQGALDTLQDVRGDA